MRDYTIKIFTSRQLSEVVSPHFDLEQLYAVVFPQKISFEAILRNCIFKIFSLRHLCRVVFTHFPLRHFCKIVFSKHFIWGNSAELYSQTLPLKQFYGIVFLKSSPLRQFCRIVFSHFLLWDNSAELYSHTFLLGNSAKLYSHNTSSLRQFYWIFILKIFSLKQLHGVVFSQNISFEAILRNCILKKFLWGNSTELYSHNSFWGNFTELYSQNISFEATLRSYILKILHLRQFYWIVFSKPSPLRQFCGIVFSDFLFWDNFAELHSHKCPRTLYPHVNKLLVTKWDVVLTLVFIYCINSTNEGYLLTPHFATINFTFLHFSA